MLHFSYQWLVLSYKLNRAQYPYEGHRVVVICIFNFRNKTGNLSCLESFFRDRNDLDKCHHTIKIGFQMVTVLHPSTPQYLLLSVQIQVLTHEETKGKILLLSPLLWYSVAMVIEKKHKNYMLTVPDTSEENPCTIMCTHSRCAIHMVRVRLYFVSALGMPRTKQCLAHSLPHLPAEWLAQIYFFYSGHGEMSRRLILDKVGKAMSLLFLQQSEGQRQSHGLQDIK